VSDKARAAADKSVYDEMYRSDDTTYERPTSSPYYPMFLEAAARVRALGITRLLEVGCGSGVLAEIVLRSGIDYRGFDLSDVAVEKARQRNPGAEFFVGDATDPGCYAAPYDGILCCEVLEHIPGDLDAMALWRPGTRCVCSVPNFDYATHVRHFRTEKEVAERYGGLIDIAKIARITKPARANVSWRQYLRKLRWARGDPKAFLGLMGVNAFDWGGGWFLFQGARQ
jgi:2-polyprenyl-3-methyl-5-hydroxy-6-metoxy-1,4-benzoquinol methylase